MTSPVPDTRLKSPSVLGDTTNTPPRPSSKHQKCQFEGCTKFARRGGDNKFCTKHLPKHLKRWCVVCKHHLAQYAGSRCSKCAGKKRSSNNIGAGRVHQGRPSAILGSQGMFGDNGQLKMKSPVQSINAQNSMNTLFRQTTPSWSSIGRDQHGELEQFGSDIITAGKDHKLEVDQSATNTDLMDALDFLISISDEECERILATKVEGSGKGSTSDDYLVEQTDKSTFPFPDNSQAVDQGLGTSSDTFEVGMFFDGGAALLLTA